jgi:hypothetical protein
VISPVDPTTIAGRWRVSIVILCLGAIAPGLCNAGTPTPFAPPGNESLVLYRHATLIDGTGAPPRPDMSVLVAGERIQRVTPANEDDGEFSRGAKSVDLRGRYLIPGRTCAAS